MQPTATKYLLIIAALTLTIAMEYTLPHGKQYVGTDFLLDLNMPLKLKNWKGRDVSDQLNISYGDYNYNFLNYAKAYNYENAEGQNLIFILIDAGNFHYPNACLTSAGFNIRELENSIFKIAGRTIEAYTIFTEETDNRKSYFIYYWIVIDKKIVPNWISQKIKQLYFSLFNKKRIGIMVRVDVPTTYKDVRKSSSLIQQFIMELSKSLPDDQADYIFGQAIF